MQQFRDQCKNTMHAATLILLDDVIKRRGLIVAEGLGPLRSWHGAQATENRDPEALLTFYRRQAFGEKLEVLRKTVSIMCDDDKLERMNFLVSANAVPDVVITEGIDEHPLILEEASV